MSGYCTVSIGSGLVDSIYGNCQVPLKSYLEKRGEAFERESLLKYLFRMETSRHWAERYSAETAMDSFVPVGEGGDYPKTGFQEAYKRDIENMTFKQSFAVTRELMGLHMRDGRLYIESPVLPEFSVRWTDDAGHTHTIERTPGGITVDGESYDGNGIGWSRRL